MLRLLKYALLLVLGAIAVLAVAVGINTWRMASRQFAVAAIARRAVDARPRAQRLAAAIRLRTVSDFLAPDQNADQFAALHAHLAASFPAAHRALRREIVGSYSLLYTWPGSDPAAAPIAADGASGRRAGRARHRGRLAGAAVRRRRARRLRLGPRRVGRQGQPDRDDRSGGAAASRTASPPRRTVHLAFGHDEEVGGERGATAIAELLAARGVRLDFVFDEGLLITEGAIPGLDQPAALIGVAEKGYVTLMLEATATPGHSSMPPRRSRRSA